MANYEDWTNSELADSLLECEEFVENEVPEGEEENVWQWDRSDLIGFAYDYLGHQD